MQGFSVFEVVIPKAYLFTLRESDLVESCVPALQSVKYHARLAISGTEMNGCRANPVTNTDHCFFSN